MIINMVDGTLKIEVGQKCSLHGIQYEVIQVEDNRIFPEACPLGLTLRAGNGRRKHITGKRIYDLRFKK